jgi:DNA-binding GntR family transcriptional regulator
VAVTGTGRLPIQRNSLREQIAGALREELMAGRLAAGSNFTVKEIAELYGVSATPAREALVDLTSQGLLRAEHHRGFTVPLLGWADYVEIVEARVLITDSAFRQLGLRAPGYDWSRLGSLRRRAEAAAAAARAGQLDVMVGCDRRFWQEMSVFLENRRLSEYLDWLRVQSWMFAVRHLRARGELAGVCWNRHPELVERIAAQDLAGAHRMLNDYNLYTVRMLAELSGESLDAVTVLGLLTAETSGSLPGPLPSPDPPPGR